MTTGPADRIPAWVVITAYPRWPSPYFAHLHRYAPAGLPLTFRTDLAAVAATRPPGVVNLHRLRRLYQEPASGRRTAAAARRMLHQLTALRRAGWRLVWTVHNLLPIDAQDPRAIDWDVAHGVLTLADTVICHTAADAAWLRHQTHAPVRVCGWTGLAAPEGPPTPEVAELISRMDTTGTNLLLLGHLTEYKNIPATIDAFLARTSHARLIVAGAPQRNVHLPAASNRLLLYPNRIPPEQVGHLYARAHAAVCPYRSDDAFAFFTDVLYPSSVATATGFGVPVVAPNLAAINEITAGHRRWLAASADPDALGSAMAQAEAALAGDSRAGQARRAARSAPSVTQRWRQVGQVYRAVAHDLLISPHDATTTRPRPQPTGDASND